MSVEIASKTNARLRRLLEQRRELFFFEGEKLVHDLLARGQPIDLLIEITPGRVPGGQAAREHWRVSEAVMKRISSLESPPAAIAVVREVRRPIDRRRADLIAAFCDLQDPANLGSIFRCAAAFGVSGLLLAGAGVRLNNPKLLRAAQTAIFDVACEMRPRLEEALAEAQSEGRHIFLTSPRPAPQAVSAAEVRFPALLVFGSEGAGLDPGLLSRHPSLTIPQGRSVESLNVGIAACILFHDLSRRRGG